MVLSGSLEQQIEQLDQRVGRIEARFIRRKTGLADRLGWSALSRLFSRVDADALYRVLGWFITTVTALALWAGQESGQGFSVPVNIGLIIGIWLIGRHSGWVKHSPSTHQLRLEHLQRGAGTADRHHLDHRRELQVESSPLRIVAYFLLSAAAILIAFYYSWLVLNFLTTSDAQLIAYLVPVALALFYGIWRERVRLTFLVALVGYLFLGLAHPDLLSVWLLAGLSTLLWVYAWKKNGWTLLTLTALASYVLLIFWNLRFSSGSLNLSSIFLPVGWDQVAFPIAIVTIYFAILFALPFIYRRREYQERTYAKAILTINTLAPLLLALGVGPYLLADDWWFFNLSILAIFSYFAYLAWQREQRFSYAKYFLVGVVGSLAVLSAMQPDLNLVTLLWLLLAVFTLGIGFSGKMYTARLTGIALLGLALLHYFLYDLPLDSEVAQPILWQSRDWLGLVFICFLPMLGLWYANLTKDEPEWPERRLFEQLTYLLAFLLFFSLLWVSLTPPSQTLLWIMLGVLTWSWGMARREELLQVLGIALAGVCLIKLLFVDSLAFPPVWFLICFLLGAAFLVGAGVWLWQYPLSKRLSYHHKRQLL